MTIFKCPCFRACSHLNSSSLKLASNSLCAYICITRCFILTRKCGTNIHCWIILSKRKFCSITVSNVIASRIESHFVQIRTHSTRP
ncbi:MAG: hypothetical protein HOI70_13400 [Opitutae bacterium]|nr:hypothetical protein [Opitutae bacterium]